jgi:hypothetical protein
MSAARGEQVETVRISVREIMTQPAFALGAADARAGRSYHANYDRWDINRQWDYERGRMWGATAPRNLALTSNGKITTAAVRHFRLARII